MLTCLLLTVDDDVRADMSDALDRVAPAAGPKGEALYRHEYVQLQAKGSAWVSANVE